MRVNERMKKLFSLLLALTMVLQYVPTTAFAIDAAESGLCEHHAEHTAECGYAEAVEGQPCTHVHDELCGYIEAVEGVSCTCVAAEDGTLTHAEDCGYVEAVAGVPCTHAHDELCGYAAAVEAHECHYECAECADSNVIANQSADWCGNPLCSQEDAFHVTSCTQYVAPENPKCYCVEKCAEPNIWCDVCGFDYTQCGGTDRSAGYGTGWEIVQDTSSKNYLKVTGPLSALPEGVEYSYIKVHEGGNLDLGEADVTCDVFNYFGTISSGRFRNVHNNSTISGGIFEYDVVNDGTISGGTFTGHVSNNGTITDVTFWYATVSNSEHGAISNAKFESNAKLAEGSTPPQSVIHSVNGEDVALTYNAALPAALGDANAWYHGDTQVTSGTVPLNYTTYVGEYAVNTAAITNGTVSVPATAKYGQTVTVTATAFEGYVLDTLTVQQGETEVTVTDNKFTMPAGDVTVTATFKIPVCTCTDKCAEGSPNSECAVCRTDLTACIGGSVAKVGNTYYTDFATAVANWTDNTTLTLLADVTRLAEVIEISGNDLVLDLNGKSMETSIDYALTVTGGKLTIRDNVGTGSFTATADTDIVLLVDDEDAVVDFESGTLGSVYVRWGTFNMTGGKIYSEWIGISYFSTGTVNVSGGEVMSTQRDGIYNLYGTLTVTGTAKITSENGYAIRNSSASVLTTISGDVALNGSDGEFYLAKVIVLNTQPAGDTTWRVNINTDSDSGIENGVFAIPGDAVTLDPAKFTSLIDGYEVKLNNKNELVLCNHSAATVAVSNGNETHNTTCDCNGTTFESNITCSGGVATATHLAVCAYCGGTYGELDANVNYDIIASAMTAAELKDAVAAWLAAGNTDISILLTAYADQEMFTAIWTAFSESTAADGSINLTIIGAKTVPEYGFFDNDNYLKNGEKNIAGDKLKSLTLTDVETIGDLAFSACTYLESVNLPQVVTIGECAFNEWKKGTKLTSLNLPNATTIGDWAFAYSTLLTSVNLPKVVTIGTVAFADCDLRTLDLPEATTIGSEAFMNNDNLVSCSAPKATTIGYHSWGSNGTSKLERLELTAVGDFTLSNNIIAYTPTEQIDLVLNKDKETQVTQNEDGTATWATTIPYGDSLTYTFKSITLTCVDGTTNHSYTYTDQENGTHKAECTVEGCGFYKYEAHTPDAKGYTNNENGTHSLTCTVCQTAVTEAHKGGEATCTEKAECQHCGASYGDFANHSMGYVADEEANTITYRCGTCDTQNLIFTLVIPTGVVYGDSPLAVPHYDCSDTTYSDGYPEIKLDGALLKDFVPGAKTYEVVMTWGDKTVSGEYTIAKADVGITAPTPNTLTYTGEAHNLITQGEVEGGTMVYSLTENGDYTTSIPQGTNAGDYTVWYYVQGDANHNDSAKASVDVTIKKATPVVTPPTPREGMSFNNTFFTLLAENAQTTGGTLMYKVNDGEWRTNTHDNWNAGTYNVYWKVVGNENYESVDTGAYITVTVQHQELDKINPTVTLSPESFVYDGAAKTPDVSIVADLPYISLDGSNYTNSDETLEEGKDFTVTYSENVNPGTTTVTIQGIGNFKGTVTRTFTITCDHSHSEEKYTNNGDGTHDKVCSVCGDVIVDNQAHHGTATYAVNAEDSTKHDVTYSCCGVTATEDHDFENEAHKCVCGKAETFTVYWASAESLGLETGTSTFGQDFVQTITVPENTHLRIDDVYLRSDSSIHVNYTYENGVLTIAAEDLPAGDIEVLCDHYVEVTFCANGGVIMPHEGYPKPGDTGFAEDGSYWMQENIAGGELNPTLNAELLRTGYTFVGWRDASGKVYPMGSWEGKFVIATEDVTLYAQWQCNHTIGGVVFRDNGNGTHNGYCGECDEPLGNYVERPHAYDETTHQCVCGVFKPFNLYADGQTLAVAYGSDLADAVADITPEKTGYTHTGEWTYYSLDEDDVKQSYTGTTMPAVELYAEPVYEAIQYNITWDMAGCSYYVNNYDGLPTKLAYNVDGNAHNVNFTDITAPEGYEFVRFEDGDGNALSYVITDKYRLNLTVSGDMTVKAVIEPKTYKATWVSFDGSSRSVNVKYGETIIVCDHEPIPGYTFLRWEGYTEDMTMPAKDVTFTAIYQVNQYTITFNTDGGSAVASITQDYGTAVTAPAAPSKDGYHFVEWQDLPTTMPAENVTIKAVWEAHKDHTYSASGNTITAKCGVCGEVVGTVSITAESKTYDGTPAAVDYHCSGVVDPNEVGPSFTKDGRYVNGEDLAEEGAYTASITLGMGEDAATASVDFTIAKKELTATVSGSMSKSYDGTNIVPERHSLKIVLDGVISGDTVTASADFAFAGVNAGTKTINATNIALSGKDAANYELKATTASADVGEIVVLDLQYLEPHDYDIVFGTEPVYNGKEQTMTVESFVMCGLDVTYELTGNTGTDAGFYTMVVTANGNFAGTITQDWQISRKAVTVTAEDQTITYGETISGTEITAAGLVDGHSTTVTLTPSTANVTADGTITASAAVITAGGTDVTGNYNVSYTSGKLVIKPDASKIDGLTSENVTSDDEETIKAVQEMLENADSITEEWEDIGENCEDLLDRIEETEAEQKKLTDQAATFDEDTVKSTDKKNLEQLAKDIEDLLDTDNLTEDEREALETVLEQVEGMIDTIEDTAEDSKAATEKIDALDPATVTSDDKDELEQAIETIDKMLTADHLTEDERKTLEDAKADAEALIEKIKAAQDATDTENTEKVEDVTADNVKPEDKEALEDAKADLEKALEDNAGNYTEEEKQAIQDEIQRIDDAMVALENVEDVTDAITQLPETVEPDDEEAAEKILDAKEAYDELTDHEKSLVDEDTKKKLDDLVASLTAYDIIKGDGGKWTKGGSTGLTFTANGPFSKFVGIEVDGKEVASTYYTAESGSTIITLKQSFLKRLSTGEHTITVLYTDGETSGTFKVLAASSTPATGDDSNIMLYGSMFTISLVAIVVLLLASKKRKRENA